MAIKFKEKGQTLTVIHNTKGPITYNAEIDVKELFWKTLKKVEIITSKRAHNLLDLALRTPEELWVIGDITQTGDQGGAAYAAIPQGQSFVHVMIWDPNAELKYDAAAKWVPKPYKPGYGTLKLTDRDAPKGTLPSHMLLMHELGHFEQFLNKRDWYLNILTRQSQATGEEFTACQGDIEADNFLRNEWPICNELGIPKRQTYWDDFGNIRTTADLEKFGVKF